METKKSYHDRKEAILNELTHKIDELRAKADQGKAEAKTIYYEQIETLRAKQETIRKELRGLKDAGEDKWEGLKEGVEHAFSDLKKSFDNAIAKLKGK